MSSDFTTDAFVSTAWTAILKAQGQDTVAAQRQSCLEYLASTYWTPVYIYVRRRAPTDDAALDLTQAYFTRFLEKNVLDQLDPSKGRFRAFLLTSVKHFIANEADQRNAAKRRPAGRLISLEINAESARASAVSLVAPGEPPETTFMREWARVTVRRALDRLKSRCAASGTDDYVRVLEQHMALSHGDAKDGYAKIAEALRWNESKVKKTLFRARKAFGDALRSVLRSSVASEADVEDELRDLRAYFR